MAEEHENQLSQEILARLSQQFTILNSTLRRALMPDLYEVVTLGGDEPDIRGANGEPLYWPEVPCYCRTREQAQETVDYLAKFGQGVHLILTGPDHPLGPGQSVGESR